MALNKQIKACRWKAEVWEWSLGQGLRFLLEASSPESSAVGKRAAVISELTSPEIKSSLLCTWPRRAGGSPEPLGWPGKAGPSLKCAGGIG